MCKSSVCYSKCKAIPLDSTECCKDCYRKWECDFIADECNSFCRLDLKDPNK